MAVGLNTGVPWAMCKQPDAPDPVVSSIHPTPFHLFINLIQILDLMILLCHSIIFLLYFILVLVPFITKCL